MALRAAGCARAPGRLADGRPPAGPGPDLGQVHGPVLGGVHVDRHEGRHRGPAVARCLGEAFGGDARPDLVTGLHCCVSVASGPRAGGDRSVRGGSWISHGDRLRSAYRSWNPPGVRVGDSRGFRLVRSAGPPREVAVEAGEGG